jgi:hypothetical protein
MEVVNTGAVLDRWTMSYAAGSWRKLKSFDGMSSMPREVPCCGERVRDGARAGDRTREGRGEGARFVDVVADRGLVVGVSTICRAWCDHAL